MTQPQESKKWLDLAFRAALSAGELLAHTQGKLAHIRSKSCENDLVTEADVASEKLILSMLQAALPEHGFLAEESSAHNASADYVWAIDPLDGTVNYAHNLPFYCVSIGLMHQGVPLLGVIHAPALRETYSAIATEVACLNQVPIQVSLTEKMKQGLLATGFPYERAVIADNNYKEFLYFANHCQDIRRPGAAALDLAYVACGRFDGFWEHNLHAWDMVAGAAIILAAGGRISNYEGGPFDPLSRRIVASNGRIHDEMLAGLQAVRGQDAG